MEVPMFSLNRSLHFIEAAEPDVVALHRSADPVVITPEDHQQQPCEAFVAVVLENGAERTYVALLPTAKRKILVYTSEPPVSEELQDALSFLKAFGFRMETCNLSYSAPLREVVIRNTGIFRPPAAASPPGPKPLSPGGVTKPAGTDAEAVKAAAAESLAKLQVEWEGILKEKEAAARKELERLSAEQARIASDRNARERGLATELAAVKAQLELAVAARDEASGAQNELASFMEEFDALRSEYVLINEELTARNSDLHQLRDEKEQEEKKAAAELAALREELKNAAAGRETAEAKVSELQELLSGLATGPGTERPDKAAADLAGLSADFSDYFSEPPRETRQKPEAIENAGGAFFRLDPSLTSIPCGSGCEVAEVLVSMNTARINPAGNQAEISSAYICSLDRNGTREVYLALYLTESRKTLIHVPGSQPSGPEAYNRVIREAVAYAETVGFFMDALPLGKTPAERAKALGKVPVFAGEPGL
jgi:hypothetical protein